MCIRCVTLPGQWADLILEYAAQDRSDAETAAARMADYVVDVLLPAQAVPQRRADPCRDPRRRQARRPAALRPDRPAGTRRLPERPARIARHIYRSE